MHSIHEGDLDVASLELGPGDGRLGGLLNGFFCDIKAYDEVSTLLAARGCRAIPPYLRAYGPTRFLWPQTPRSGQRAILSQDLLGFMDAPLGLPRRVLALATSCGRPGRAGQGSDGR
jgi:hypothetical protein